MGAGTVTWNEGDEQRRSVGEWFVNRLWKLTPPPCIWNEKLYYALDAGKHVGIYYICIAGYANLRPSLPWKVSDVKPSRRKWGALGLLWSPVPLSRLLATRVRKCLALNKDSEKVSNWTKVQCVFFVFALTSGWQAWKKRKLLNYRFPRMISRFKLSKSFLIFCGVRAKFVLFEKAVSFLSQEGIESNQVNRIKNCIRSDQTIVYTLLSSPQIEISKSKVKWTFSALTNYVWKQLLRHVTHSQWLDCCFLALVFAPS